MPLRPTRNLGRRTRLVLILALLLPALAIAAAVGGWFAVRAGAFRAQVIALIERRLSDDLGADVRLGELAGPLYPKLEAVDVEVAYASGERIDVERVTASYAISWSDGRPRIDVETLVIDAPAIHWPARASEEAPPGEDADVPDAPAPFALVLHAVEIRRGVLLWEPVWEPVPDVASLGSAAIQTQPGEVASGEQESLDGERVTPTSLTDEPAESLPRSSPVATRVELSIDGTAREISPLVSSGWLPASASARVRADVALATIPEPIEVELALNLAARELEIAELSVRSGGGTVQGSGRTLLAETLEPLRAALALELREVDLARVTPLVRLRSSLSGPVRVSFERAPETSLAEADLAVEADLAGSADSLPLESLTLSVSRTGGVWSLASARIRGDGLTIDASGTDLATGELSVRASVPDLALLDVPLASVPETPWLAPTGGLELTARIDVRSFAAEGELRGTDLGVAGRRLGALVAELAYADDVLSVRRAELRNGTEQLRLRGRLRADGLDALEMEFTRVGLTGLARWLGLDSELGGALSGTLRADGPWSAPAITADLALRDPRFVSGAVGPRVEGSQLRVRGRVRPEGADGLELELTRVALAGLERWLGLDEPLGGTLSGTLRADGAWSAPALVADLALRDPRLGAHAATKLDLDAKTAGDRLELAGSLAAPWCEHLAVDASLRAPWLAHAPDAPIVADLSLHKLDLAWLGARGGAPEGEVEGRVSGSLTWRGRAARAWDAGIDGLAGELSGELALAELVARMGDAGGERIGPIGASVRVEGATTGAAVARAGLRGSASWGGFELTWDAAWPSLSAAPADVAVRELRAVRGDSRAIARGTLRGGALAGGRIELDRVDVAEIAALLGLQPARGVPDWAGRLSVQLDVTGALQTPEVVGAGVWEGARVSSIDLERIGFEIVGTGPELLLNARVLAESGVVLDTQLAAPREILTRPVASWGSVPGARASFEADALDLRLLAPLFPRGLRAVAGTLSATVEASGTPAGPQLAGMLDLRGAQLAVPALQQTFTPIDARAVLAGDRLRVETLSVQTPQGGVLSLSGHIDLAGLAVRQVALRATLSRFDPARLRGVRFALDGAATLGGPWDALDFAGEVTLANARLSPPPESDPIWQDVRIMSETDVSTTVRETPGILDRAFEQSRGRLLVRVPARTWVSAGGAELELVGDVEIRKQPHDVPRFFGGLDIQRGRYQLGRRTLTLARGSASLTGSEDFDPLLDARATTQAGEYAVTVELGGLLSSPTIELSSDPPLARNDVLAVLLFGKPSYELEASRAAAIELVFAQLGGEIGLDDLRARLGRYLPFDTFSVDVGDDASARVEIGRYLRDDVFVRYGRSVGTEQASDQVTVEWQLTPEVRVESQTSSDGSSGADVIWQKDY